MCLLRYSWECWAGYCIRRGKAFQCSSEEFLDGLVGSGEADGVVEEGAREVVILGILLHHTQEGNRMAPIRRDGDLDSGAGRLLEQQQDTWLEGLGTANRSPC